MTEEETFLAQMDEMSLLEDIAGIVKAYPNDKELGAEIRRIYGS